MPYPAGTVINVNDYKKWDYSSESYDDFSNKKGKPATFIYTVSINFNSSTDRTYMEKTTTRIIDHTVANETELEQLSDQIYLGERDRATVLNAGNGEPAKFVYYNDKWTKLGITHNMPNTDELEQLQYAEIGDIAKDGANRFIFYDQEWLPTTSTEVHETVQNQAALEQLSVPIGEIVAINNQDKHQHFFYTKNGWKQQTMGGNAGTITITTNKGIRLFNDSQITTQAINSGGGGIIIKGDGLLHIVNSKVSSSVKAGAGNGGNLTFDPKFITLENGKILAQANEGGGGNININTDSIYLFGDEIANPIDASSKLGIDGEIEITSLDIDISGQLFSLSTDMTDASAQIQDPCSSRIAENLSSFALISSEGISNEPGDLLPSKPYFSKLEPLTITNKGSVLKIASYDTGCKLKQSINK
ncbi:hypothetical protein QUF74_12370 [Candidatus Halobeggiatoa sp. HSG11]|nr:hypothetical protein [Candidatus Halobeggiatoa sp. HSG11]